MNQTQTNGFKLSILRLYFIERLLQNGDCFETYSNTRKKTKKRGEPKEGETEKGNENIRERKGKLQIQI